MAQRGDRMRRWRTVAIFAVLIVGRDAGAAGPSHGRDHGGSTQRCVCVGSVSGRATFEIIRERLGPRTAAANLSASFFINLMTLTAEIGGVALALQLATDVGRMMWIPVAAFAVWVVVWRVKFSIMENVAGLLGLLLIAFAVSVFALHPNWGDLIHQATAPVIPEKESAATYWYFAIALLVQR
jgi:Mn2+/Fe2+ NRAMP family transporter